MGNAIKDITYKASNYDNVVRERDRLKVELINIQMTLRKAVDNMNTTLTELADIEQQREPRQQPGANDSAASGSDANLRDDE